MTLRTSILGATDWSDGQVLYAADLNDTVSGLVPKFYSNIGSYISTDGGFKSNSLIIPANAIGSIVSLDIRTRIKLLSVTSGAGARQDFYVNRNLGLYMNGSNIGSLNVNSLTTYILPQTNMYDNLLLNVFIGSISNTGSLNILISGTVAQTVGTGSHTFNYEMLVFGNKYIQL
jgi:hypothetical protein